MIKALWGMGIVGIVLSHTQAHAFDTYIGLNMANNTGSFETKSDTSIEQSGLSYNVAIGATLSSQFAIELFYTKFSNNTGKIENIFNADQEGYGVSLNYRKPVYKDLYVMGGIGGQQIEVYKQDKSNGLQFDEKSGFDAVYSAGLGYRVSSNVNFEVKYSRFQEVNTVGGTLIYRF